MTRHKPFVLSALFLATFCAAIAWSTDAAAQGRAAPRSSSGRATGVAVPRSALPYPSRQYYGGARYYRPYYYRPYYSSFYSPFYYPYYGYPYYGGFYGSFGWGFGIGYGFGYPYAYGYPYYGFGYGYGQYPYPYYGPIVYDYSGSARLQVTPRNTQVYIDGYFVGVVDSFDGNLQRLHVEAGEHELQLYLDGHRTFTQKVLFPRGGTLRITHVMQPLGPGESAVPPPKPDESMRATPSNSVSARRQGPPPRASQESEFGSLLLRVRPADADILVDGELWTAPEGEDQFVIELTEGPHRIEVRKDGFQTYATTVRVRRGEAVRLNVSLTSGSGILSVAR